MLEVTPQITRAQKKRQGARLVENGLGDLCAMRAKCAPNVRHVKVRCKSDLNLCETQMSANLDFSPPRY